VKRLTFCAHCLGRPSSPLALLDEIVLAAPGSGFTDGLALAGLRRRRTDCETGNLRRMDSAPRQHPGPGSAAKSRAFDTRPVPHKAVEDTPLC
jgi:hypothetical protein